MSEQEQDSVQNRFTGYLVVAVTNKRIRYMEQRNRRRIYEVAQEELLDKRYLDFDVQYHKYVGEQTQFVLEDWERFREFMEMIESEKLSKAIDKLKERDRKILFAKVFGSLSYAELGEMCGLKVKQAEMAYFYVLRKLRKELEKNNEL